MEIERLMEDLNEEEMKKLLPIFIKYCYDLEIKDYICLYKEVEKVLNKA